MGSELQVKLLVTTAIEEAWGNDRPVVFLGEWCKLYGRKAVWSVLSSQTVPNHWDDRKKLRNDHDYLKELYGLLLVDIARAMNEYHQIERPLRYWQMVVGAWLLSYVAVIWDRWECLRLAFSESERLETVELSSIAGLRASSDYSDFSGQINSDQWNYHIFLEIIKAQYARQCKIIAAPETSHPPGDLGGGGRKRETATFKHKAARFVDGLLARLPSRGRVVFFQSYFPPRALLRLNMSLMQLPRLYWSEFDGPTTKYVTSGSDHDPDRGKIKLTLLPRTAFEAFLIGRIARDIPSAYAEGFEVLRAWADRIALSPKVILTASAHWANEAFKVWSAEQVFRGAKLVIMDNGGSFPPAFGNMSFPDDIADVRTKWSIPFHSKHIRLPANKLADFRLESTKEYLAVVGNEMPRYTYRAHAHPHSGQTLVGYNMVCELYSLLADEIKSSFRVKPYPDRGWNIRQRYIDNLGREKVSDERSFYGYLSRARIVVATYPQTTFSEAMASGLPAILYYPAHLWETIHEMDPLLEVLKDAKIIFHSPESAANHINDIWSAPDIWWNSPDVLRARREFHRQISCIESNWLKAWLTFINGLLR